MPKDIENYVHRIGRTGRGANKGLATTFIDKDSSEVILRDLKELLKEAKQRIPPLFSTIEDRDILVGKIQATGQQGCIYCSGLGHRVINCTKWKADKKNEFQKKGNSYVGAAANI